MYRRILPVAGLLLLAGCFLQGNLARLKNDDPQANDFHSALAAEYLSYAEAEQELGHPVHANYFAGKGLDALEGKEVPPDDVNAHLPELVREQLAAARNYLMTLLTTDMKRVSPQQAARAQLLFDCWQHQLAKHPEQDSASCSEEFKSVTAELETVAESFAYTREMSRTLTFSGKKTALGPESLKVLDDIAHQVSSLSEYEVDVQAVPGSNGAAYLKAARKRMLAVRAALIERGVPPDYIELHDDETSDTVYLSDDEEKQPHNTVKVTVKAAPPAGQEEDREEGL